MRTIIAGGRDFQDYALLYREAEDFFHILHSFPTIVTGGARGADSLGKKYALEEEVKHREFPAKWDEYGKSAGYRRNVEMAEYAEALLAFWDGKSKGTKHMIDIALEKGLLVKVVRYENSL